MHNSVWKLTSLATVVGVALFFIVQAQKLMKPHTDGENPNLAATSEESESDFSEDDAAFPDRDPRAERQSTVARLAKEPDPFADEEGDPAALGTAELDSTEDSHAHNEQNFVHASGRTQTESRRSPSRQPTLRLPRENRARENRGPSEDNPFDDGSEADDANFDTAASSANEPEGVGPRLSLPGRKTGLNESDSAETITPQPTIRRTSAEETLAEDDSDAMPNFSDESEEDAAAFSSKSRSTPASPPRLELADEEEGAPVLAEGTDDAEFAPKRNASGIGSRPRLDDEADLNREPTELGDSSTEEDDAAVFSRQARRESPRSNLDDLSSEETAPDISETPEAVEPEFPGAENPMPSPIAQDDDARLFPASRREKSPPKKSTPTLADGEDEDLFPEAESEETAGSKPNPRLNPTTNRNPRPLPEMDTITEEMSTEEAVPGKPYLTIHKKSPPSATLGEKMIYEIRVSNPGTVPAHQVVLNDDIPDGVDLDGTIPRAELSGRRLIWRFGTLQPGEEKLVKVRVIPVRVGEVGSVATVNFLAENDADAARNVPANYQLEAQKSLARVPQLEISTSSVPQEIGVNQKFRVALSIKNTGRLPLTQVILTAELDPKVRHQEVDDSPLECPVGDLQPGQAVPVDLDLVGIKPGMSINRLRLWVNEQPVREAEMNFRVLSPR